MYQQEASFVREKNKQGPPLMPLRLDTQYAAKPMNLMSPSMYTPRAQMTDYSMYGGVTDRPVASSMVLGHDYSIESARSYRSPQIVGGGYSNPYAGTNTLPNINYQNKMAHVRQGSQNMLLPNTHMMGPMPTGYSPMNMNMNYPHSFSHSTPVNRSGDIREEKVLKFLERQNAVIEKLAIRIQQEERESMQREKKELEQKLRDLQTEKILRQQEDSLRHMAKANSDESHMRITKAHLDRTKSPQKSSNTLEALGKFYLMSTLFDGKATPGKSSLNEMNRNEMKRKSRPEIERARDRDTSIVGEMEGEEEEEEEEPPTPEVKPKSLKRLNTQKSMKIQPVVLQPLMMDEYGNMIEPSQQMRRNGGISNNRTPPDEMFEYGDSAGPSMGLTPRNRYPGDYNQDYQYNNRGMPPRGMGPSMDPTPRNRYPPDYRYNQQSNYPSIHEFMDDDRYGYGYGDPRMTRQMSRKRLDTKPELKKQKTRVRLDSARALDAVEEIRKQQDKKKNTTKQKLGAALWAIAYPHLLFSEVQRKVENRKMDIQKRMSSNIQMNFEIAQNFLITVGERYLKEMILEAKPLDLFTLKKPFSESELTSRVNIIFASLKGFFDKLIVGTNTTNLPKNFLRFLASISEDASVLPSNFMFDFEIKRLQFTIYATLKFMSPLKSKMVIGLFILLRVLVHQVIMRPWKVIPEIKENKVKINNLRTIGSIIYHIALDFFRGNVPIYPNNQNFLPSELRVKPRSVPLGATDNPPDLDEQAYLKSREDGKPKEVEPMSGFLTKEQLKCFFVDRKKQYDQLKALVDGWLEKIYQLTHTIYLNTPKEDRETLGIPE